MTNSILDKGLPVSSSGATISVGSQSKLQDQAAVPEPLRAPGDTVIRTSDRQIHVLAQMALPRIVLFGNVLSDAECDGLVALARPKLAQSHIVDPATGAFAEHAARTSEGTYFLAGEHPLVDRLDRRIAELLQWPVENGEGLQILHYRPGGEYQPQYDYFEPAVPQVTDTGGNRVATLILYLQSCEEGGWTAFPDVGFQVAPQKGCALFFSYSRPSPETKTLHAGLPVIRGEKWIATRWMRERAYLSRTVP